MTETYSREVIDEKFRTHTAEADTRMAVLLEPLKTQIAAINTKIAVLMTLNGIIIGGVVKLVFFP